jgi:perosamine synthetase
VKRIPQMEPLLTEAETKAATDYLSSGGWLTEFEHTRAFEKEICDYTGAGYCVAAPNGTLAIFLALSASGVRPGDEVIVPDLTMAASATAVVLAGAKVVFADIEAESLCLDPRAAERLFTERTRAVVLVSLNGRTPRGFATFVELCRRRNIKVIEDAAQSLGSFSGPRHLGTFGDCGCFSFSSQKIVSTGQGGAVVTNDRATYERMSLQRDFGRHSGGSDHYVTVGWNLKFTDLQAVIGLSQLRRLPQLVEQKRALYRQYQTELGGIEGLHLPQTDLANVTPWFVDVLVDAEARPRLIAHLQHNGIGSRPFYPALHAEPAFATGGSFPISEGVAKRGLWLPSSLRLSREDVTTTCDAIRSFFARR